MIGDPLVGRLAGLRRVDDLPRARSSVATCKPKWSIAGARRIRIAGQEVHELRERAGVQDQRVAGLAGVVALGPAEHVAVEVEELGATVVVEQRRIHR